MAAKVQVMKNDLNRMLKEIELKVTGIASIKTPYNKEQMAKAVFTIAGTEFIKQTNRRALSKDPSLKHVYEWNREGRNASRLFVLVRSHVSGGVLIVSSKFLNSKTVVPIHPDLIISGRSGRRVTAKHIFKKKAEVMESGKPVRITAKTAKALAIPTGDGGITFIRRPRVVTVKSPGGTSAAGGFGRHMQEWFRNSSNIQMSVAKTAMLPRISRAIAKELNRKGAGPARVSTAIKSVTDTYSKGLTEL